MSTTRVKCGSIDDDSSCSSNVCSYADAAAAFGRTLALLRMLGLAGWDGCCPAHRLALRRCMFDRLWGLLQEMNDEIPKA